MKINYWASVLTNGNSAVWTTEISIRLRYGTHAQLVVGTRQEAGKGAGKRHCTVTTGGADRNTDQILLCNVAFNELLWIHCLQCTAWTVLSNCLQQLQFNWQYDCTVNLTQFAFSAPMLMDGWTSSLWKPAPQIQRFTTSRPSLTQALFSTINLQCNTNLLQSYNVDDKYIYGCPM